MVSSASLSLNRKRDESGASLSPASLPPMLMLSSDRSPLGVHVLVWMHACQSANLSSTSVLLAWPLYLVLAGDSTVKGMREISLQRVWRGTLCVGGSDVRQDALYVVHQRALNVRLEVQDGRDISLLVAAKHGHPQHERHHSVDGLRRYWQSSGKAWDMSEMHAHARIWGTRVAEASETPSAV